MNSTNKDVIIRLFAIALIIFFIRSMTYWFNAIDTKEYHYDAFLFYSNVFLLFVCAISVTQIPIKKNWLLGLCILWVIDLIVIICRTPTTIADIPKAVTWPILYITTYAILSYKKKYSYLLRWVFVVCTIIGLFGFFSNRIENVFSGQSNLVYFPLLPLPFIMLKMKRKSEIVLLFVGTVIAVMGMKRSMLLAFLLTWMLLLLYYFFKQKKVFGGVLVSLLVVAIVYYGFNYVNQVSHGAYTERFNMEDVSNGREDIYDVTWLMIYQSELSDLWLGHGYNTTARDSIMDRAAHNDFLETLYDYGIVGSILLVLFWIYILVKWVSLFMRSSDYIISYSFALCIIAVMSMVSVLIMYNSYFNYLIIYMAAIEVMDPGLGIKKARYRMVRR